MSHDRNVAVSTKSTLPGASANTKCPRCGMGTNDLEAHLYQIPSGATAADMNTKYAFACLKA